MECVEPLCPECITQHIDAHHKRGTPARIENIHRVRKECQIQVEESIQRLQQDAKQMQLNSQQQIHYQNCIQSMRQQHKQIAESINEYFVNLENQLQQRINHLDRLQNDHQKIEEQLQQDILEMKTLSADLDSNNYVRTMIQVLESKQNLYKGERLKQLEQAIVDYENQLPFIQIDNSTLDLIKHNLQRHCYITTKEEQLQNQQVNQNQGFNSGTNINNQQVKRFKGSTRQHILDRLLLNQQQPQQQSLQGRQSQVSEISQWNEIQPPPSQNVLQHTPTQVVVSQQPNVEIIIDANNYFDERIKDTQRVLVEFEEESKNVNVFGVRDRSLRVQTYQTNMRSPMNHRSIVLSDGTILLTGGINRDKNRFKGSECVYEWDQHSHKFEQLSNMCYGRCMHVLCEFQGSLYAVGGSATNDENGAFSKVERMDINTRKWQPLQECPTRACGCTLTPLHEYLVKAGGKIDIFTPSTAIEIYNVYTNTWIILDYTFSGTGYLRLPFNAQAVTIQPNTILIFGGSVHDVKSNQSQEITINQEILHGLFQSNSSVSKSQKVLITPSRNIPRPGEFPTQTAFIQDNLIWALQTTENHTRSLCGEKLTWKEY